MKISLIIATLNRKEELENMIDSILNQTYQNFEIVIVDQSDEENTSIKNKDSRIKYIHIKERGLSHARNIGIENATGDIIGLSDDDAKYQKKTLEIVNDEFNKDNELFLVGGVVIDPILNKSFLTGMGEEICEINYKNVFVKCCSASIFIKKEFFDNHKFDENLGIGAKWGSAEETDIILQILYDNHKCIFNPNIIVEHPYTAPKDIPFNKLKNYSLGFGAMFAKHKYELHNKTMMKYYYKSLCGQIYGALVNLLKFNFHMVKHYMICFKYKKKGYKDGKKYYKK